MKTVGIVGAGRVGLTLGYLLQSRGYTVAGACCRRPESTSRACQVLKCPVVPAREFVPRSDLVIIATPDDVISTVTATLAASGCFRNGQLVLHTSGARTSADLRAAAEAGACTLSFHPLRAFPQFHPSTRLEGCLVAGEGDTSALDRGEELARALGARWQCLRPGAKLRYHAGAVMACNYLVVLLDAAYGLLEEAGFAPARAREALDPLVRGTLDHVLALGPAAALTGPVARGDVETVSGHMEQLDPSGRRLYCQLGLRALELARAQGLDAGAAGRLRAIFEEGCR